MTYLRRFDPVDQERFAVLTGDRNPIHVDPVYARRTLAGATVVHGIHILLWALDAVAAQFEGAKPSGLRVSFDRFLLVGESATVRVARRDAHHAALRVETGGVTCCSIELAFGSATTLPAMPDAPADPVPVTDDPVELTAEEVGGMAGWVAPAQSTAETARSFPQVAGWLGEEAVAALGTTTRLVGMLCPGLHSIFKGLRVGFAEPVHGEGGIRFSAGPVRHGLVDIAVAGSGVAGNVTALVRTPPVRQPAMRDLAALLPPDAFVGTTVLVAGGSRGLGELAAKLLATGGADVVITWSEGEADARAVAQEIAEAGRRCGTLRYRIGDSAEAFARLPATPTHGYYFAAPTIANASSTFFDGTRLRALERFFVDGFWDFARCLQAMRADVRLFYPSTVYVERWPKGLAEYAMAKAMGEILCTEMNARLAPLSVVSARLPRLPTDQTATLHGTVPGDPVAVLLPLIRAVQRG